MQRSAHINRSYATGTLLCCTLLLMTAVPGLADSYLATSDDKAKESSFAPRVIALSRERVINAFAYEGYINGLLLLGLGEPYAAIDYLKKAQQSEPESFEISYTLAELYYQLRDPSIALKELNRTKVRNADYYRLSSACHQSMGDLDKAIDASVRLVELAPDDQLAYSFLANAYRQRQNLDSTLWAYEHLSRLSSNNFRVWSELGQLRMRKMQIDSAMAAFRMSIRLERSAQNINSFSALGDLYNLAHLPETSKVILKEALTLDSDNVVLHRQLLQLYADQDSFARALPHALRSVALSPLDRNAFRRLGWIYLNIDSLNQADSIFTKLIDEGEDLPVNRYYLGHIAIQKRDYRRAREQFGRLAAIEDTIVNRWLDLAYAHRMLGHTDSELVAYREGINRVPSDTGKIRLKFAVGAALERQGQIDSAISVLEHVVAESPRNAQALNYLGYLLADKNLRLDYARDLIKRALDMEPTNAAYLDSYGWVYFRLGDLNKAIDYLTRAAELTSDATIFDHLGDAYSAQGKPAEARVWWQKALDIDPQNATIADKLKE